MTVEQSLQFGLILCVVVGLIRVGLTGKTDPFEPFWEARKSGAPVMAIFILLVVVPTFFQNQQLVKVFTILFYIYPLLIILLGVAGVLSKRARNGVWRMFRPSLKDGSENKILSLFLLSIGVILFLLVYSLDWGTGIQLPLF